MSAPNERPLSERLAKWQRTWRRIAERVFNEDSRVQAAQDLTRTEVNSHAEGTNSKR